jgi:two-component system, cell cycle sensor histidine kinase and response regulator CckA
MFSDSTASGAATGRSGATGEALRILVVDENPRDRAVIADALKAGFPGCRLIELQDPESLAALLEAGLDVVVADHRPSWIDAFHLLGRIREKSLDVPVLLCTGTGSEELAVAAMKAGFDDYILKHPHHFPRLVPAIRSALEESTRRRIAREAETRYRSLFEGVPVGLYRATLSGQVLDANPALLQLLGFPSRESLMAVNMREIYVDPKMRRQFLERLEREGEVHDMELQWKRYGGQIITVRKGARPVRDPSGRLLHYEGVVEDITERKRARRELQESNQFRQEIIHGAGEGIVVYDRDLRYIVWNRYMEQMTGLLAERVLGRRPLDVFPFLRDNGIDRLLERALGGDTASSEDVPYAIPETGNAGWAIATYGPHRDSAGQIVGVIGIVHDVTERRRAEQALRESEERFRLMADAAPVMIWTDDAGGMTNYFNKPWLDFTGRTLEQEVGLGSRDSIHPEDLPRFVEVYTAAQAGRKAFQTEYRLRRHDGEYRWVLETAMPRFAAAGEFEGFIGSVIDISERRQAEEAVRESEERFRFMADAAPVMIWLDDESGKCTYFSKPWLDFTGRRLEDELGLGWFEGVHPDDQEPIRAGEAAARKALEPFHIEYRLRRKDGEYRWIFDTAHPRFTPSGVFAGYIGSSIDITDRRRAGEALAESEARYRTQVEHAPEAIVVFDVDTGRFVEANENALRLYGLSREELFATGPAALSPPTQPDGRSSAESAAENIGEALNGGTPVFEWTHVDAAGRVFPCEVRLVRLPSAATRRLVRGSVTDISERKHAEKVRAALYEIAATASAAEELDEFYAAIHGIVGELMYARNIYVALHNPDAGTLSFPYCVDEQDPPPVTRPLQKGLTEYVLHTGEPLLMPDEDFPAMIATGKVESVGSPSIDWLGVPLKTRGRTFGVLVVQSYDPRFRYGRTEKDVLTFVSQQIAVAIERKGAQEAVRESEERYRLLFERNMAGVYRVSLNGRIVECNDALAHIYGYSSREELVGRDVAELHPDEAMRQEFRESLFQFRTLANLELRGQRKDGSPVWTLENAALIADERAGDVFIEGTVTDITGRKLLEEQLRQSQKMEAIGQLAGGIAHDFNNLLTTVLGYSNMALNRLSPHEPIREEIEEIQKAGERAANLTRQLLAFSRKQLFEPKVLDVNARIVDSTRMLARLIGERVRLVTQLDPSIGSVRADPGQIEQVLVNLVVNARDAMPDGGTLTIRTRNADVDLGSARRHFGAPPGAYVVLSVADTGVGIDPDTQKRIFEPFFTTKEKPHGTGLGLATVYGIVRQSGGQVYVSSEPGHGASFLIYLPRVDEAVSPEPALDAPLGPAHGSETILLVEDEDPVRELTRRCLEQRGYAVLQAASAEEAMDLVSDHAGRLDLLLTDVVMPGASGPDLARRLTTQRPDLQVLFVSGYPDDSPGSAGLLEPGAAFLQKPFTADTLARKVRDVLDSRATAAAGIR